MNLCYFRLDSKDSKFVSCALDAKAKTPCISNVEFTICQNYIQDPTCKLNWRTSRTEESQEGNKEVNILKL